MSQDLWGRPVVFQCCLLLDGTLSKPETKCEQGFCPQFESLTYTLIFLFLEDSILITICLSPVSYFLNVSEFGWEKVGVHRNTMMYSTGICVGSALEVVQCRSPYNILAPYNCQFVGYVQCDDSGSSEECCGQLMKSTQA